MKSMLIKSAFCTLLMGYSIAFQAQENRQNCSEKYNQALVFLHGNEIILKDSSKAIQLLSECADSGYAEAQYLLGMLYKEGKILSQDKKKAFSNIKKAAQQNHLKALCELGVLYKDGIGCKLNFNTAIEWFEKAEAQGNSKGSYSIGYMYFKGLGSIEQNYNKAIEWFERSDYPMAKHWLGICNYFGYGIPVNKDKALELWLDNPIGNSEVILKHIEDNPDLLSLGVQKENTIKATEFKPSKINEVVNTAPQNETTGVLANTLTSEDLVGDWQGKLIELDWSKNRMNRSFPVEVTFTKNETTNDLDYSFKINETQKSNFGILLEDSYHFEDLTFELPRIYQDDTLKYHLDYKALSLSEIEIKKIDNINYFTAIIDTKVTDWQEPGAPMLLVLGNTKTLSDNGKVIDTALLEELAKLKDDSFITLYPNPFKSDLLIQYDLANPSTTSVEIRGLDGQFNQSIVSGEKQEQGNHLYHIDGSNYLKGVYVVRVITDGVIHTKLVIKE